MTRTLPRFLAALLGPLVIAASLVVTAAPASAATPLAAFSLSSTHAPSVFGQSVTLFANLTGTTTSPTGTVDFFDGGSPLCSAQPLSGSDPSSVATCTASALSVGSHGITATYSGDVTYSPQTTSSFSQVVGAASTTTGLAAAPTPSTFSESVTLTATVLATAPGAGTPAGAVAFKDNGVDIAGCSAQTLTTGSTTCVTTALGVASHPLTAVYAGGSSYFSSTSSSVPQNVTLAATTTAVATSDNTTLSGQPVTFTATTTPTAPATVAPSAGTVSFNRNGTPIASCGTQAITTGTSTCTTSILPTGTGSITAVYSGSTNYGTSTAPGINQTVSQSATTTNLVAAPSPSVYTGLVTLTATVAAVAPGDGTPTGTVAFQDAGVDISGCASKTLTSGAATCDVSQLAVASHNLSASYAGTAAYAASSDNSVQSVNRAGTTTAVVSGGTPSVSSQSVTFTATVAPVAPASGAPSEGTVSFEYGGAAIATCGTKAVTTGTATCATTALPVGTDGITAVYSGNTNYMSSTSPSINQTVNVAPTTTAVVSDDNTTTLGESVTFTAVVSASAPATVAPSAGTVSFNFAGSPIAGCGTQAVTTGTATCATTALPVGTDAITAVYSGNGSYATSTASSINQTVGAAPTATAVLADDSTTSWGTLVTFTATVTPTTLATVAPSAGTVSFQFLGTAITGCGTQAVATGTATCATSALPVGTDAITAIYSGTANYTTSTSPSVDQTVSGASTTTALGAAPNPSVFSQSVTFTTTVAVVSPGTGTPTGNVAFQDDGVTIVGCETLALNGGGVATCTTNAGAAGDSAITAVYAGASPYATSTSSPVTQTVNKAAIATAVVSDDTTTLVGQLVTLTVTVSPTSPAVAIPSAGTVDFKRAGTSIAGCSAQPVTSGTATCGTTALPLGTSTISATYSGSSSFNTSTSGTVSQTVSQADTTTDLQAAPSPSVYTSLVTLTATVAATAPAGGTPTGNVAFQNDGVDIPTCSTRPLASGAATCTVTTLTVASHTLSASYAGSSSYAASTDTSVQVVDIAATTTAVAANDSTTNWGAPVTFTATIAPVAPATVAPSAGTVSFESGGAAIASCGTQAVTSGTSTCTTSALPVGTDAVTAVYSGNANYGTSTSPNADQIVSPAPTTTAVGSGTAPSVFGQSVTFTATVTVTDPATGIPTGTVAFLDDGVNIVGCGTQALGGAATATCATTALGGGPNVITAVYAGATPYATSTSAPLTQTVTPAPTTTAVATSDSTRVYSQTVTLTATVTGTPTPSAGTVSFRNGGTAIASCGTQAVVTGTATCTTSILPAGNNTITAVYSGNANYGASTAPSISQTVSPAVTTAVVAANSSSTTWGQPVIFTATVAPVAPATLAPSAGTVSFTNGGTAIPACGARPITAGSSTCTTIALPAGTHTVAAVYSGNGNYTTSTAPGIVQTVSQSATTVALTANDNPASSDQSVTFTATMSSTSPSVGVPTGSVAFFRVRDDLTREWIGTSALTAGAATVSTDSLPFGANTISAIYRGSDDSLGSNTTATETIYAGTATTVVSTRSPAMAGRFIGFQATVSSTVAGAGTPTGAVAFFRVRSDQTREWIGNANLRGGVAKVRTDQMPVGTHTIVAVFRGGPDYGMSTGNVTQVITG